MDWSRVAADFEWDGMWRDIYVLNATLADWQVVLDLLRAWDPRPSFFIDGEVVALPDRADAVFALRPADSSPFLSLDVGGMGLNCHFFGDDEIEFDLDPREVNEGRLKALCSFMKLLAKATGKPAVLTYENGRSEVILRSGAGGGDVEWQPQPGLADEAAL